MVSLGGKDMIATIVKFQRVQLFILVLDLIFCLGCGQDPEAKRTKEFEQVKSQEKPSSSADFCFKYLLAMEARDNKKMSQLVEENLNEVPKWLEGLMSVADLSIKSAQGGSIMVLGDKQLNARTLSQLLDNVAREYKALTNDSKLLQQVKQWQATHRTELAIEPPPPPPWDVQTFLEEYKHALNRNDETALEALIKCSWAPDHPYVLNILDLTAYLQYVRPQYEFLHEVYKKKPEIESLASGSALSYQGAVYKLSFTPKDWINVSKSLTAIFNRCHGGGKDIVGEYLKLKEKQIKGRN
jgi:hypothetical protein